VRPDGALVQFFDGDAVVNVAQGSFQNAFVFDASPKPSQLLSISAASAAVSSDADAVIEHIEYALRFLSSGFLRGALCARVRYST